MSSQQEFNVCSQTRPTPCTLHPVPSNVAGEQVSLHRNTVTSARALVVQLLRQRRQVFGAAGSSSASAGARLRGGNEYAGTYPAKMSTMHGAHFRGWCTNSRANLCAGARLRGGGGGGERIRCYTGLAPFRTLTQFMQVIYSIAINFPY